MGQVIKQTFKYKGDFDFRSIINFLKNWMQHKYYDFSEPKYKEKPSDHGIEIEMDIVGDRKVTEYIKNKITISIHVWDMTDKEVGTKKTNTGRIQMDFKGDQETDWQGNFNKNPRDKKIKEFFENKVLDMEIGVVHADALYYEVQALMNDVKTHIGMITAQNAY